MSKKNKLTSVPPTDKPEGTITLGAKHQKELAEIERKGLIIKCQIADITEQLIIGERQRQTMFDELYKVNSEYRAKLDKIAGAYGIDVDADPKVTGERYHFDAPTSTFTRHDVPKPEPTQS
jgi:hypothetical protein